MNAAVLATGQAQDRAETGAESVRSTVLLVAELLGQAVSIVQLLDQTQGDDAISAVLRLVVQDHGEADEMESGSEQPSRLDFSDLSVSVSVTQSMLRLVNTPERDCSPLSGVDTILQVVIDRLEAQQSSMGRE
jgi:hypothetical protein